MIIPPQTLVTMTTVMDAESVTKAAGSFATDAEISASKMNGFVGERELEKWEPDPEHAHESLGFGHQSNR